MTENNPEDPKTKKSIPKMESSPTIDSVETLLEDKRFAAESRGGIIYKQFKYFCKDTSLHGYEYLTRFRSASNNKCIAWMHRISWFLIILFTFVFGWYQVGLLVREFFSQTPIVAIEDTTAPLTEIYFPSVTICNLNQVTTSQLLKGGLNMKDNSNLENYRYFIQYILGADDSGILPEPTDWNKTLTNIKDNLGWDGVKPFVDLNGTVQNCEDMIVETEWNKKFHYNYRSDKTFTDFGVCCRIYPELDFAKTNSSSETQGPPYTNEEFLNIDKGAFSGIHNGLSIVLDVESFDTAFYPRKSEGFVVAVSGNLERPLISQSGTYINPGSETLMAVKVIETVTTDRVVTKFKTDTRKCYMADEFDTRHFTKDSAFNYSMSNCLYSSMVDVIQTHCNCSPIFEQTLAEGLRTDMKVCSGRDLMCMQDYSSSWGDHRKGLDKAFNLITRTQQTCYDNCNKQTPYVTTSTSSYPSINTLRARQEFCLIVKKIRKICDEGGSRKDALESEYTDEEPYCTVFKEDKPDYCNNLTYTPPLYHKKLEKAVTDYTRQNLAVVKVYMQDPYYTQMQRAEVQTGTAFMGAAGGWLGLCCGLSFISLLEIAYHGLLLIIALYKKKIIHT